MLGLRTFARPMLASVFVIQGYQTFRNPEAVAPLAEPVVQAAAERLPAVPAKTEHAVRINGAVQMVAGSLLALGRFPRLSALAIALSLAPTTAAGHRFWEADDEQERTHQRIHFLKNLSMAGGLLVCAADTSGRPSLAWRSRHAARSARSRTSLTARTAKTAGKAGSRVGRARGRARVLRSKYCITALRRFSRDRRFAASARMRCASRRHPAGKLAGRHLVGE